MSPSGFQLPPAVREAIRDLAARWLPRGAVIWLFGSFATGTACRDSDLDLAVEWAGVRDEATRAQLLAEIEALPTVRPIDVVDLSEAAPAFIAAIRPTMRRVA